MIKIDTIKAQLKIPTSDGYKIAHLETDSEVVLHSDSTVSKILNNISESAISKENISDFMLKVLKADSAENLCKFLKVYPALVYDECALTWETVGSPKLEDSALVLNGASYIYKGGDNNYINFGGKDFTIDFTFKADTDTTGTVQKLLYAKHPTADYPYFMFDIKTALNMRAYYQTSKDTSAITVESPAITLGETYQTQLGYDSTEKKFYLFLNGVLQGTIDVPFKSGNYTFYIGATQAETFFFKGKIFEFRFSNGICRNKNNFTPPSEPYPADSFCTSLLHFD